MTPKFRAKIFRSRHLDANKRSILGWVVVPLLLTTMYFAGDGEHPAGMSPNNIAVSKVPGARVEKNAPPASITRFDNPSVISQLETSGTIASVDTVGEPPKEDTTESSNDIFEEQQNFYQHIGDFESEVDALGEASAAVRLGDYSVDADNPN